jgi:chemotaxis signal transduction protein
MPPSGFAIAAEAETDLGHRDGAPETWVLFLVDEQKYALRIWEVERIVRAVEVKALPRSPAHIRGVVNVHGQVLPVVDLRVRIGQPARDIRLEDHFIIAQTAERTLILVADVVLGSQVLSGMWSNRLEDSQAEFVAKTMTIGSEVVFALDLERLMSPRQTPPPGGDASAQHDLCLG